MIQYLVKKKNKYLEFKIVFFKGLFRGYNDRALEGKEIDIGRLQ